ncbi:MAG: pyridoxamine 5'-phosphate oxidase family protein [Chloroflexota bacterium]
MLHQRFNHVITSVDQLTDLLGNPSQLVLDKDIGRLDHHCRAFIALSPYLLLGTSNAAGQGDVSPRGDGPGFVTVLDDQTLVIPERPGNRRADSLRNILDNPHVGLIFLIPGFNEALRINGQACLIQDEDILAPMAMQGKTPQLGIAVEIENCFLHCARAILRAGLWDYAAWPARETFPSLAEMLKDQTNTPNWTKKSLEELVAKGEKQLY